MADARDEQGMLQENLRDAGFSADQTEYLLQLLEEHHDAVLKQYMEEHRKNLLVHLHRYTEQLDCLDYFTYIIQKRR